MNNLIKDKNIVSLFLVAVLTLILSSILVISLGFQTNPSISPTNATRRDNLVCSWTGTNDVVSQNVNWYNGTNPAPYLTDTAVSLYLNKSTLNAYITRKDETWYCNITLFDSSANTTMQTSVNIQNAAPDAPNANNESMLEDSAFTRQLTATDPDGDAVTFGLLNPDYCTIASTGLITCNPENSDNGQRNYTFYSTDSEKLTGIKVTYTVIPVNDAPYFNPPLSSRTAIEDVVFYYNITGADEESNTPYNFSINTSFIGGLIIVQTSNSTASITFSGSGAPEYADTLGSPYTVQVNITDYYNNSHVESFVLTINSVNHAPLILDMNNTNGSQGVSFFAYINSSDSDQNQILTYSINTVNCSVSNPWTIQTINNGTWNGTQINAIGLINISNITNDHVICNNINITVTDNATGGGAQYSRNYSLNISNINDPPVINEMSFYSQNGNSGYNISNLSGAKGVAFSYKVNGTDPDQLIPNSIENLSYTINDSTKFVINSTTGLITNASAMDDSYIGNYSYNITVFDGSGLSAYRITNITIINNTAPIINVSGNLTCMQGQICIINISVIDPEGGPYTWNFISNTGFAIGSYNIANLSQNRAINFTPTNSLVGNHSINISIIDPPGASDNYILNFSVLNVNDAPFFDNNRNEVRDTISISGIVVNHVSTIQINVTDLDLNLAGVGITENLTFTCYNASNSVNCSTYSFFSITKNNDYSALIVFNPANTSIGNYSFNFTVTDLSNYSDSQIVNFTIFDRSSAPIIREINPYGRPISTTTVFELINTSNFTLSRSTTINISENSTVTFRHYTTDEAVSTLIYQWYYDSSLISTSMNLSRSFNFFSSGLKNVTLMVIDETYMNTSWEWLVNVSNVNRAPSLRNSLINVTGVNQSTLLTGYFDCGDGIQRFIDDDDDINSNGQICSDSGEVNNLTYSLNGSCNVATVNVSGQNLIVNPIETGNCYVSFIATDSGGLNYISNVVLINVSKTAENTTTPTPITVSGGGSSRQIVAVPTPEEVEVPQVIELLIPQVVVIYKDRTIKIPILIKNNWSEAIKSVRLSAHTNITNITFDFDQDYFEVIGYRETKKTSLTVTNYRLGENFEIKIDANVSTPPFSDSATVLINSLEREDIGQKIQTKVTFARDLLQSNPECLELNELLKRAEDQITKGDYENALRNVDSVIEGCKYLISQKDEKKPEEQKPLNWFQNLIAKSNKYLLFILLGLVLILLIIAPLIVIRIRKSREANQKKETK